MGAIGQPKPCKLIVGMLAGRAEDLAAAAEGLRGLYGPTDLVSQAWDFSFTHYYDQQMGAGLLRQFLAFERLIRPEEIVAIKRRTNEIEEQFGASRPEGPPRPVNLDPGYITESKLVLASTKDFAHRIYLADGIYAEVTLNYVHRQWAHHPYTFPDYGSGLYDSFLTACRDQLRKQLGRG